MRKFNTAGPSVPSDHYMLDPLARVDLAEIESMIEDKRYFVLHAPRQTGKTTALLALMAHWTRGTRYHALYANVESAQTARNDVAAGMAAITQAIARQAQIWTGNLFMAQWLREHGGLDANERLGAMLSAWAQASDLPTVLMIDEVDALVGDTLISLLRQIRSGYPQRPTAFPQTVILCGVRDVRDYRIQTSGQEIVTGGSAFNIKAKSIRMGNFSQSETQALWQQHADETGRIFDPAIWEELWEDSRGQPWLVNALGHECTWEDRTARDPAVPITLERYRAARESLIQSRATHLDALVDKLREPRVRGVIAPILAADEAVGDLPQDDRQYVEDLGLIRSRPQIEIANRIYREVIPRELNSVTQTGIAHQTSWYVDTEHRLDMPKLLAAFQQFFREHSESWLDTFAYKEAGPQLLMQAFLQRIVNGGGRITREYGLGRKRTDLLIEWPLDDGLGYNGPMQRIVIELKLVRSAPDAKLKEGLAQVADYAQRCGADEAHLVLFDRRDKLDWDARIWQRSEAVGGRTIEVWGL